MEDKSAQEQIVEQGPEEFDMRYFVVLDDQQRVVGKCKVPKTMKGKVTQFGVIADKRSVEPEVQWSQYKNLPILNISGTL